MTEIEQFSNNLGHALMHTASMLTLITNATESEDWKRQAEILADRLDDLWQEWEQLKQQVSIIRRY